MPSSIRSQDILWTRTGDPILVDKFNEKTGEIYLNNDYNKIQKASKNGIKNGLDLESRKAYNTTLSSAENEDKKQEIKNLYQKIKSLKENNTNPRLLKYLENELQFRIIRENFRPEDYSVDALTIEV